MEIEKVWNELETYWKKHDSNISIGLGDSSKEIEELERKLKVMLPDDLKYSLQRNYHFSRRGRDGLRYSWLGDLIETNLLSSEMIQTEHISCLNDLELNIDNLKNIYIGNIMPYMEQGWSKNWIPILVRYDVDIVVFLDLRQNSNKYGQVLMMLPYVETKEDGYHNRIAFIAKSYTEFMKQTLEYIKKNGGLKNEYFLNLLNLPKNYYEDDIQ